jgi:hypothetical protein
MGGKRRAKSLRNSRRRKLKTKGGQTGKEIEKQTKRDGARGSIETLQRDIKR